MAASFPAVSQAFMNAINDVHFWWLGEKYDGVRGCWNTCKRHLYSRYGIELNITGTITKNIPASICFDCELWFGRGMFGDVQRIITADSAIVDWSFLRLITFDILEHDLLSFEKRYSKLLDNVPEQITSIIVAPRVLCFSKKQLLLSLKSVLHFGGEGVILRRPLSMYYHGRSPELIKLKASRGDMEALVLKVKRQGIKLVLADGSELSVPIESVRCSPKIGDVVSFSYEQTAKRAMPANVRVFRIRKDVNWEIVLQNYHKENSPLSPGGISQVVTGLAPPTTTTGGRLETRKKMRRLLEDFARSHNLNPLLAKTWYRLSKRFHQIKEIGKVNNWIQKNFQGSVVKALVNLFPNISILASHFPFAPRNYWAETKNRRVFLENYARDKKFDPLVAENWYRHHADTFRLYKGGEGVLAYYDGNYVQALAHLFPELHLDEKKLTRRYWLEKKNQQNVFVEFAAGLRIDPFSAEDWYSVNPELFYSSKSVASILQYYSGNHVQALTSLFPDLHLEKKLFSNYWAEFSHRKQLFINYAASLGLRAQDPDTWHSTNLVYLHTQKGIRATLRFYEGSVVKALVNLFSSINLNENKLHKKYVLDLEWVRQIFIAFAARKQFDHLNPKNWYEADLTDVPIEMNNTLPFNHRLKMIKLLFQVFSDIGLEIARFGIGLGKMEADIKARRLFFILFAKEKGFDPLVPENWYSVPSNEFLATKEARTIVVRYGGSFPKALLHLFPNIGLQRTKFAMRSLKFWRDGDNKRQFFKNIANLKGFNPLVAENWYIITLQDILHFKGAQSILPQYDGSFVKALQELFGFEFDKTKFVSPKSKNEMHIAQRRLFFDQFAAEHNFDPHVAENWYFVTLPTLLAKQGGAQILQYYDKKVADALRHVYPEMDIIDANFVVLNPNYWLCVSNRKAFFKSFAKEKGFDPLLPDNWHALDFQALKRYKCAADLMPDRPSVAKNLLHVFPDIGLDKKKFKFLSRNYWIVNELQHKQELFVNFAISKGFDPLIPCNWYSITEAEILSYKDVREMVSYKRGFAKGLLSVFPNIGLEFNKFPFTSEDSKLTLVPSKHWQDITNQRNVFIKYASQQGFDPLLVTNWYSASFEQMKMLKGIRSIRGQHKTLPVALQVAFPDVSFDFQRFTKAKCPK
eukprot:Phypoly_transcript_00831.p1 GENE.Phypoly_transcript_00831~~Phypoly_transcript_00831.p1  ORF type:complete len:1315 (+),score=159.79 Phypoly_transcript_00831:513-3947(+)